MKNVSHHFQYKKPELVAQMERETLRILQDVETEADDDIDIDLMKKLLGTGADAPNPWKYNIFLLVFETVNFNQRKQQPKITMLK